jgi:hypothetical protein
VGAACERSRPRSLTRSRRQSQHHQRNRSADSSPGGHIGRHRPVRSGRTETSPPRSAIGSISCAISPTDADPRSSRRSTPTLAGSVHCLGTGSSSATSPSCGQTPASDESVSAWPGRIVAVGRADQSSSTAKLAAQRLQREVVSAPRVRTSSFPEERSRSQRLDAPAVRGSLAQEFALIPIANRGGYSVRARRGPGRDGMAEPETVRRSRASPVVLQVRKQSGHQHHRGRGSS